MHIKVTNVNDFFVVSCRCRKNKYIMSVSMSDGQSKERYAREFVLTLVDVRESQARENILKVVKTKYPGEDPPKDGDIFSIQFKRPLATWIFYEASVIQLSNVDTESVIPKEIKVLDVDHGFFPPNYWSRVMSNSKVWFNSNRFVHSIASIVSQFPDEVIAVPPLRDIIGSYATTSYMELLIQNFTSEDDDDEDGDFGSSFVYINGVQLTIHIRADVRYPRAYRENIFIQGLQEELFSYDHITALGPKDQSNPELYLILDDIPKKCPTCDQSLVKPIKATPWPIHGCSNGHRWCIVDNEFCDF